jgi:hypothetical protein
MTSGSAEPSCVKFKENFDTETEIELIAEIPKCFLCEGTIIPMSPQEEDVAVDFSTWKSKNKTLLHVVWHKIFQYSRIPKSKLDIAYAVCKKKRICSKCLEDFNEIGNLYKNIIRFELYVKYEVNMLAKILVDAANNEQSPDTNLNSLPDETVWKCFKLPVIQSKLTCCCSVLKFCFLLTDNIFVLIIFYTVTDARKRGGFSSSGIKSLNCHKCDFKAKVYLSSCFSKTIGTMMLAARRNLSRHYARSHLPYRTRKWTSHKSNKRLKCLSCPYCPFQTKPKDCNKRLSPLRLVRMKNVAIYDLFCHCKNTHDKSASSSSPEIPEDYKTQLEEGKEIVRCPQDGCTFIASVLNEGETPEDYRKLKSAAQSKRSILCVSKLGTHFMRMHDFPASSRLNTHPCLQILKKGNTSEAVLKCPRCEFQLAAFKKQTGGGGSKSDKKLDPTGEFKYYYHYGQHISEGEVELIKPKPIIQTRLTSWLDRIRNARKEKELQLASSANKASLELEMETEECVNRVGE